MSWFNQETKIFIKSSAKDDIETHTGKFNKQPDVFYALGTEIGTFDLISLMKLIRAIPAGWTSLSGKTQKKIKKLDPNAPPQERSNATTDTTDVPEQQPDDVGDTGDPGNFNEEKYAHSLTIYTDEPFPENGHPSHNSRRIFIIYLSKRLTRISVKYTGTNLEYLRSQNFQITGVGGSLEIQFPPQPEDADPSPTHPYRKLIALFSRCKDETAEFVKTFIQKNQKHRIRSDTKFINFISDLDGYVNYTVMPVLENEKPVVPIDDGQLCQFVWIPKWAKDVIYKADFIVLDASFKAVKPYVYCVAQAIRFNESVPVALSIAPTERSELYSTIFDSFEAAGIRSENLSRLPVLTDLGSALKWLDEETRIKIHLHCHRHIIETFGSGSLAARIVTKVLKCASLEDRDKLIEEELLGLITYWEQNPDIHNDKKFKQAMTMLVSNREEDLIRWAIWLRGNVCRTTNHCESFHQKVNSILKGKSNFSFMYGFQVLVNAIIKAAYINRKKRYGRSAYAKISQLRQNPGVQTNGECHCAIQQYLTKLFGFEFACPHTCNQEKWNKLLLPEFEEFDPALEIPRMRGTPKPAPLWPFAADSAERTQIPKGEKENSIMKTLTRGTSRLNKILLTLAIDISKMSGVPYGTAIQFTYSEAHNVNLHTNQTKEAIALFQAHMWSNLQLLREFDIAERKGEPFSLSPPTKILAAKITKDQFIAEIMNGNEQPNPDVKVQLLHFYGENDDKSHSIQTMFSITIQDLSDCTIEVSELERAIDHTFVGYDNVRAHLGLLTNTSEARLPTIDGQPADVFNDLHREIIAKSQHLAMAVQSVLVKRYLDDISKRCPDKLKPLILPDSHLKHLLDEIPCDIPAFENLPSVINAHYNLRTIAICVSMETQFIDQIRETIRSVLQQPQYDTDEARSLIERFIEAPVACFSELPETLQADPTFNFYPEYKLLRTAIATFNHDNRIIENIQKQHINPVFSGLQDPQVDGIPPISIQAIFELLRHSQVFQQVISYASSDFLVNVSAVLSHLAIFQTKTCSAVANFTPGTIETFRRLFSANLFEDPTGAHAITNVLNGFITDASIDTSAMTFNIAYPQGNDAAFEYIGILDVNPAINIRTAIHSMMHRHAPEHYDHNITPVLRQVPPVLFMEVEALENKLGNFGSIENYIQFDGFYLELVGFIVQSLQKNDYRTVVRVGSSYFMYHGARCDIVDGDSAKRGNCKILSDPLSFYGNVTHIMYQRINGYHSSASSNAHTALTQLAQILKKADNKVTHDDIIEINDLCETIKAQYPSIISVQQSLPRMRFDRDNTMKIFNCKQDSFRKVVKETNLFFIMPELDIDHQNPEPQFQ